MWNAASSPVATNCIMWGDAAPDSNEVYNNSSDPNFRYCDIQGSGGSSAWESSMGIDGGGNIDADPLFVNGGQENYILKSEFGRISVAVPGLLWSSDPSSSPCIDAGDPASEVGAEPEGNGDRINMGAFGGTVQASKSSYVPTVEGDIDGDGDVDGDDFVLMAANWMVGVGE